MGMGFGGMGWGSGGGGMLGIVPMMLWWLLLVVGIALLVKWLFGITAGGRHAGGARDILAERYARGEIDREEFENRKRDLRT
jgi:putative membrane protein